MSDRLNNMIMKNLSQIRTLIDLYNIGIFSFPSDKDSKKEIANLLRSTINLFEESRFDLFTFQVEKINELLKSCIQDFKKIN